MERSCHGDTQRHTHAGKETSKDGNGQVDFGNGAFKSAYSFNSRFEDGKGTNPEELLAAAHAGCPVSQALAGTTIALDVNLAAD